MAKEAGDVVFPGSIVITRPSDGTGDAGDAVTWDGSGNLTPVTAVGEEVAGILTENSPDAAGEMVALCVEGLAIANVDGAVALGNVLEPEGTTAGRLAANAQGSHQTVDEGGTAVYDLAMQHPRAYSAAGGDVDGHTVGANEGLIKLP